MAQHTAPCPEFADRSAPPLTSGFMDTEEWIKELVSPTADTWMTQGHYRTTHVIIPHPRTAKPSTPAPLVLEFLEAEREMTFSYDSVDT